MPPTDPFTLSFDLMPLVVLTVHQDLGPEAIEDLFAAWRAVLERKEPFVALNDMRSATAMPNAKQRARTAALSKSLEPLTVKYSLGRAMVISSTVMRGAMTAIEWVHPSKVEQAYVGTMLEGYDWCLERLRRAGLPPSVGIRAYRSDLVAEAHHRASRP